MAFIEIEIKGDKEAIRRIKGVESNLRDLKKPLGLVGKALKFYFSNQVFSSQGGAIGARWPKLADSTVKYKRKHYPQYAAVPLMRTGAMQKSFTYKSARDSVTITNSAPQFPFHQSSAPRHKIPYRPMMAANDSVRAIVKNVLQEEIHKIVKAA